MPASIWKILEDLGVLGVVGAVVVALVMAVGRLIRGWWQCRKARRALHAAHVDATFALLDDALRSVPYEEVAAASQRAAIQQRLTSARERLARCSKQRND